MPTDHLFRYTNGRFLVNEEYELTKRYSPFDVGALCQLVSSIIKSPIVKIDKREGGYNKALLMTGENGHTVIAKIPCPNIVPHEYGTASEVAVLKFGMIQYRQRSIRLRPNCVPSEKAFAESGIAGLSVGLFPFQCRPFGVYHSGKVLWPAAYEGMGQHERAGPRQAHLQFCTDGKPFGQHRVPRIWSFVSTP